MSRKSVSPRNILSDKRGNVAITFGLTSLIAVAAVGGALDLGRAYKFKSQMQTALDISVSAGLTKYKDLANTAALSDAEKRQQAKDVAIAMFGQAAQGASLNANDVLPSATFDNSGTDANGNMTIIGTASGSVNTPFINVAMAAFGQQSYTGFMSVSTTSGGSLSGSQSTTSAQKRLEVSIMVDLTGSMGWSDPSPDYNTKIDALKAAGLDILDILLPTGEGNSATTRVAIAPFADFVNAGPWAAAATGLAGTGGSYSNRTNLAQTGNGQFTGTYSGLTGGATGSQAGATASQTTYDNGYCANPTTTTVAALRRRDSKRVAIEVSRQSGLNPTSSTPNIEGLIALDDVNGDDRIKEIDRFDGTGSSWHNWLDFYSSNDDTGYFAPLPENPSSLTIRTRTANGTTGNVGVRMDMEYDYDEMYGYEVDRARSLGLKYAPVDGGYWRLTEVRSNGSHYYEWKTSGWYLPLYTDLNATTTVTGCEDAQTYQASAKLITCVTERDDTNNRYNDEAPSSANGYVGAYNARYTSKSNYSSNGKCMTAGRELAEIIPLTNQRGTLNSFFNSMQVGGATPGHLGTAWAWYMLSPNWANVFVAQTGNDPAVHTPAAYTDSNVIKAAILMSDGEYNVYYANGQASAAQAGELCTAMKAKGIKVYTIGFGMGQNVTANASGTAAQRAKYTLEQCSSGAGYHYFPYDGNALRQAFQTIGTQLKGQQSTVTVQNGARITR